MDLTATPSLDAASVSQQRSLVKEEPADDCDGTYECLICSESVKGHTDALQCSECQSNPFHRSCVTKDKWLQQCPTCQQRAVNVWSGKSTAGNGAEQGQGKRQMMADDAAPGAGAGSVKGSSDGTDMSLAGVDEDVVRAQARPEGAAAGGASRKRDASSDGSARSKRARTGGQGSCPHGRRRSECKECGGSGICPHGRQRRRCKECQADLDDSLPGGLEEL